MEVKETPPNKSRKRKCSPEKWKKNVNKKLRYTATELPRSPSCGHKTKRFSCASLSLHEVRSFHEKFYQIPDKVMQDNFILKHVSACPIQRVRNANARTKRALAATYFIEKDNKEVIPICKPAFLNILNLKKHRVAGVLQRFFVESRMPKERRGGDHVSHKKKHVKDNIKKFIKKFKPIEKHYCRGKSERQYLSSDLNIKKIYDMYMKEAEPDMHCKLSFFRSTFNGSFNIGFNAPQVDVCSQCLEHKEKIKREKDAAIKQQLMTEQRIHKLRAKSFFAHLREEWDDLLTISYDCEKNLVLPKIPDQITYYKRQLYLYNFSVVVGSSKSKLTKQNVFMHSWLETESLKGSNEIASAVYDTLNKINIPDTIQEVRLVSDGCSGQNKNSTMLAMAAKWFTNAPKHIKMLQIVFPVTGHSFLPADRVFAFIEKKIKKLDTIIQPEEYYSIFEEYGTLKRLGFEWDVQDWKQEAGQVLKPTSSLHFKINSCKRLILTGPGKTGQILVKGEPFYTSDVNNAQSICKQGKKIRSINPKKIKVGSSIKLNPKKLKNIDELLTKHYGQNWIERSEELNLKYYKSALKAGETGVIVDGNESESDDQYCVGPEIDETIV